MRLNKIFKAKSKKTAESPAAMLKRVESEIKADEMRAEYAARKANAARSLASTHAETIKVEAETINTVKAERREAMIARLLNFGPLVIISGLAITGQYGKFQAVFAGQLGDVLAYVVAALCAVGLEMIALFLGYHGMRALRRKDSAAGLLLGATIVAGLVAWMNFDYFGGWVGLTFGLFSFVGPFLWRTKIRSEHRDELAQNGEIELRGLKLPRVMWVMHPIKSFKVYRHAAWTGVRDVTLAITQWQTSVTPVTPEAEDIDVLEAMIENIRIDMVNAHGVQFDDSHEIEIRKPLELTSNGSSNGFPISHPKWNDMVSTFAASLDAGTPMKVAELAQHFGLTNRVVAGKAVQYVKERKNSVRHDGSDLTPETA